MALVRKGVLAGKGIPEDRGVSVGMAIVVGIWVYN